MKRLIKIENPSLIIGSIILFALLCLVLFPHHLAQTDPMIGNRVKKIITDGGTLYVNAPFKPDRTYWFGSDIMGRDLYSRIIYGTGITLGFALLSVFFKFLIAIPFAYLSAFNRRFFKSILRLFDQLFNGIPTILFLILILGLPYIYLFEINGMVIIYACVIAFFEWPRVGKFFEKKIGLILSEDFIQGEKVIGKSMFQIGITNVKNHLMPTLLIQFFLEMSRSLLLIAQLGVFGIFISKSSEGGGMFSDMALLGLSYQPGEYPEWGSLIASARYALTSGALYMILYPVLFFFIAILGFNLFGEGLKQEVESREQPLFNKVSDLINLLSPIQLFKELLAFKKHKKSVIIKLILLGMLITSRIQPFQESTYQVDSQKMMASVQAVTDEQTKGRLVTTSGNQLAADYIIHTLSTYGIEPLYDDAYTKTYDLKNKIADIIASSATLTIEDQVRTLTIGKDYQFVESILVANNQGIIITLDQVPLIEDKSSPYYHRYYYLLLDEPINRLRASFDNTYFLGGLVKADAYTLSLQNIFAQNDLLISNDQPRRVLEDTTILIDERLHEQLKNAIQNKTPSTLSFSTQLNETQSMVLTNVGGIIRGSNPQLPPIIIATSYDYFGYPSGTKMKGLLYNGTSIAASLELARNLAKASDHLTRDILFCYFDGSLLTGMNHTGAYYFKDYYRQNFPIGGLTLSLNYLGMAHSNYLFLDPSTINPEETDKMTFLNNLTQRSSELGTQARQRSLTDGVTTLKDLFGKASGICFQETDQRNLILYQGKPQSDPDLIDEDKLATTTQTLLDSLLEFNQETE